MTRRLPLVLAALVASTVLAACGSESNEVEGQGAAVDRGAKLFADRCSGCHTMAVVGAQGGAEGVHDTERVDGPNFDSRKECADDVLRAIRQGGFSGAIMPENIVVGEDARAVAAFLEKYSGTKASTVTGAKQITCG